MPSWLEESCSVKHPVPRVLQNLGDSSIQHVYVTIVLETEHRAKTKFASQPAKVVIVQIVYDPKANIVQLFVAFFVGLGLDEFFLANTQTTQQHDKTRIFWQTQIIW